jgi:hypothetical protein
MASIAASVPECEADLVDRRDAVAQQFSQAELGLGRQDRRSEATRLLLDDLTIAGCA